MKANLLGAMRHEYLRSAHYYWWSLTIKLLLLAFSFLAVVIHAGFGPTLLLLAAAVGQVLLFWLRSRSALHQGWAETIRFMAMVENGLAIRPESWELVEMLEVAGIDYPAVDPATYYESRLPASPRRLLDITAEAAYFSSAIAKKAASIFWVIVIVATAVLITCFVVLAVSGGQQSTLQGAAKIVLLGVVFWVTDDFIQMALRYQSLASKAGLVCHDAMKLRDSEAAEVRDKAYRQLSMYQGSLAGAPLLPSAIYGQENTRLTAAWSVASRAFREAK